MSKIILGNSAAGPLSIDLELLLRTRGLMTANSGGGKSYGLRRMAEQIYPKVPQWIIDIDGEFSSLREKAGFVLVGKGGETPADPRSVEIVVDRLLEHGASAIFDLYDMKPEARHHYVRVLLEALMNAPKSRWRNLVIHLDEGHKFAPEKGQGESEAYGAVVDLATRGRKRGFCLIVYTQRLAKISKNVTAELLNRLVGMTFEDIDVESSAKVLSVASADRDGFKKEIKGLIPGSFYGLGPAISKERILIKIGPVMTTHPEPGSAAVSAPPPAPDKLKALLPKLADLPKEAEEKAKNEKDLRAEIRSLKAQLAARPKETVEKTSVKTVVKKILVPLVNEVMAKRIQAAIGQAVRAGDTIKEAAAALLQGINRASVAEKTALTLIANTEALAAAAPQAKVMPVEFVARKLQTTYRLPEGTLEPKHAGPVRLPSGKDVTPAQGRILHALASLLPLGREDVPRNQLAARAGASHRSSSFANNLGALRSKGLIEYTNGGVRLSVAERDSAPQVPVPSTIDLLDDCTEIITPAQTKILKAVHAAYPDALTREDLAQRAETSVTSSSFANNLGALRSAGMIEYGPSSTVKASDWLFVD